MMKNLRLKFVFITMSMLTAMVLILLVISDRYDRYWDEYDTYRIVKLVAANGYVKENTDEAIAFVTIDENDKPDIQVNNTFLANKEVKEVSKDLLNRGKKSWKWHDYIYSLKEKKDGTWQVVFIDFSNYSASYAQIFLVTIYVIFGLLLLTGVSIYLSRFIVQPAQDAIDREKRFVSDASHELKTPIASIRANAQVLQSQITPNRYLNHILSETKRMEHLIQELLGLSKLDKDGRAHFDKINFSSICQEMILSYESLAYEEGKLIEDNISENIEVLGQESQLKQLITILLDNAIKHSLDKGKIKVDLLQEKKTALLRVSNPSQVYPDDVLNNIFERFYQAEDSRNSSSSFGLGLAIAKAIVEKHKGSIKVWQVDGNLTFEVQLPIK
ncbi:HAMP domain-containing sensor histidine kinase [Streptococcus sp. UBA4344]|uniref:sensor histidine kinase n=2 Tax=Streptococcus TaxID=1301 RepID=UPI0032E4ED8D